MKRFIVIILFLLVLCFPVYGEVTQVTTGDSGSSTLRTSNPGGAYVLSVFSQEGERITTSERFFNSPLSGTFKNLYVSLGTAPGAGNSRSIYLRVNGSNTALTCTISNTDTTCADTTNTVSITAGDTLSIWTVFSVSPAVGTVEYSMQLVSNAAGESILGYADQNNFHFTATKFYSVIGSTYSSSGVDINIIIPTAGTFSNLYTELETTLSSGSYTFTVRKNGADTSLSCAVTSKTCADTSNSFTVAAGDLISIKGVPASVSAAGGLNYGIKFTADNDGEFMLPHTEQGIQTAATGYRTLAGDGEGTTEVDNQNISAAFTAKKIYVGLTTAPGAGNSVTFALRKNGSDTALACTVSDTDTACNYAEDVTVSAGDTLTTKQTSSGTPAGSSARISYLGYNTPSGGGAGRTRRMF